jgi:hypothetical protein
MTFDKFFRGTQKVEKFQKMSMKKSQKDKRKLELEMLSPEVIPEYTGEKPKIKSYLDDRTVRIVFPDVESYLMFKRNFRVSKYIEKSVANPTKLIKLVELIDKGLLIYDEKKETFSGAGFRLQGK